MPPRMIHILVSDAWRLEPQRPTEVTGTRLWYEVHQLSSRERNCDTFFWLKIIHVLRAMIYCRAVKVLVSIRTFRKRVFRGFLIVLTISASGFQRQEFTLHNWMAKYLNQPKTAIKDEAVMWTERQWETAYQQEKQKSTWSEEQNPARCWRHWEYYRAAWPSQAAKSARLLSEQSQMAGGCSSSGAGGNCISFHALHLQPFSVKKTIFWFFKVNHKGNRKEKKTNKSKLGKNIPEQQERAPVGAVYVISAKESGTVKVFASPQPPGNLVLYAEQRLPVITYVHSQRLPLTQASFPAT